jgi:hypothetical protein
MISQDIQEDHNIPLFLGRYEQHCWSAGPGRVAFVDGQQLAKADASVTTEYAS